MRRLRSTQTLVAVAAVLVGGTGLGLAVHGCGSDEPPLENLCGWLGDPENCYRTFFEGNGARCGSLGRGTAPKGAFLSRDALDICVLTQGGQVLFDPPLDLKSFPLKTASFKFVNPDGTSCGSAYFGGTYSLAVALEPFPPDGGTGAGGGAPVGPTVPGGTFSITNPAGRQTLDVACPSGSAYHFDLLQTSKCEEYAALVPRAELESNAGGITPIEGFVRFRVYYPPTDVPLENAQPVVVEYFDCSIPPAPVPCANGVKDGAETDIDCGGSQPDADGGGLACPRCPDDSSCIIAGDCVSGVCAPNKVGIKKCQPGGAGGGGTGGGGTGGAATGGAGGAGGN